MCGIVGLVGEIKIADLIEALEKLEYRGYDSAGLAFLNNGKVQVEKTKGKVADLKNLVLDRIEQRINVGIAHTRWATHGEPNDINAHPHLDCSEKIVVVHNGIIENFRYLKNRLIELGHRFFSETDTEVIPHLIEEHYKGDLFEAIRKTVLKLEGSFAIAVMHADHPNMIVGARKGSPLIACEHGLASDVPPLLKYTKYMVPLNDEEIVVISEDGMKVFGFDGVEREKRAIEITWSYEDAQKSGFKHFMLKEIFEEPMCLVSVMTGRIKNGKVHFEELEGLKERLKNINFVKVVACGTSYHAALSFKYFLENLSDVNVDAEISSEFRYKRQHLKPNDVVIAISQSGETADTLESVRLAKRQGATVVAITNVVGSTLSRESDFTLYLNAGPEISVAATKSYVSQITLLYLLALKIMEIKGIWDEKHEGLIDRLLRMPEIFEKFLDQVDNIHQIAAKYKDFKHFMYIGRGYGYPTALEGALKLKEISYIHATAYPAGELKHGPIAMLGPDFPVFAVAPNDFLFSKTKSNIIECRSRKARIVLLTNEGNEEAFELADDVIFVSNSIDELYPILMTPAIQLFAYYVADELGLDPDKPRNLAKSVTVE
ncbi:glutamine--fructose-6-phosphate transaminase (isomerizing) [Pseudothermotoga thermarum]|uniref:Glutamine--fructose-6-phosphate aminotransferase [isomerizing] n=1 Tax=Pseudothermotoga thermarum DSM 5069 TaxID=688269 RepID=F7YU43_9THEM|nr:glutamine--fructose-6-phosphate transaminase (isomerizing) [Pseudothermotoga thermarum]AEH50139.1 glutamine--fructose-6-phosphate transaminase [Pseudothermotoga thermarum DSM 5069]